MRSFFRVINSIFFVAAFLAAAFCAYEVYSVVNFPKADYEAQIAEIKSETEETREKTIAARKDFEDEIAYLRENIRNLGDEGVALADRIEELEAQVDTKTERLSKMQKQAELFCCCISVRRWTMGTSRWKASRPTRLPTLKLRC